MNTEYREDEILITIYSDLTQRERDTIAHFYPDDIERKAFLRGLAIQLLKLKGVTPSIAKVAA